jgi:hypothetical protein
MQQKNHIPSIRKPRALQKACSKSSLVFIHTKHPWSKKADESNRAPAEGGKDNATASKDTENTTERTKKEFPKAPDTVIGMQDERGKRE